MTDINSGWTEFAALLRRSDHDVIDALNFFRAEMPLPLLGLDTDNGSEFINYQLLGYCRQNATTFTRGRAYKKNDQAHVEEKNGSNVRRLIGYDRYDGLEAYQALTALYAALRLFVNFFQPSLKLLEKSRVGTKSKKKYDKAMTPCQRLLVSPHVPETTKEELEALYKSLDPVILMREVEILQDRFWQHATQTQNFIAAPAAETVPAEVTESVTNGEVEARTRVASGMKRQYRKSGKPRKAHTWRTREDPFADVRERLMLLMKLNPQITAIELLRILQIEQPERFNDNLLRTLQRASENGVKT